MKIVDRKRDNEIGEVKEKSFKGLHCCCYPIPCEKRDIAEDHETAEAEQLFDAGSRGRQENKSCQRIRSWTAQNEMRKVLGRMTVSAAWCHANC